MSFVLPVEKAWSENNVKEAFTRAARASNKATSIEGTRGGGGGGGGMEASSDPDSLKRFVVLRRAFWEKIYKIQTRYLFFSE
jgi:hypothetical protein